MRVRNRSRGFSHNEGEKCVGLYIATLRSLWTRIYIRKYIESFLDKAREQWLYLLSFFLSHFSVAFVQRGEIEV